MASSTPFSASVLAASASFSGSGAAGGAPAVLPEKGHVPPAAAFPPKGQPPAPAGGAGGTAAGPSSKPRPTGPTSPVSPTARPTHRSALAFSSVRSASAWWWCVGKTLAAALQARPLNASHSSARTPSFASSKPRTVATSGPSAAWQSSSVTT